MDKEHSNRRYGNLRRASDYLKDKAFSKCAERVGDILEEWMGHFEKKEVRKFFTTRSLPQEVLESLTILEIVAGIVEKTDEPLTFIDLCCGRGFLSCLLSFFFTDLNLEHTICATDIRVGRQTKRSSEVSTAHFEYLSKFSTMKLTCAGFDIHTNEFQKYIEDQPGRVVLLGIHLCKKLSLRAVDLFHSTNADTLILAPCCIPSTKKRTFISSGCVGVCRECMSERKDKHEFWDQSLFFQMRGKFKYLVENKLLQERRQHARHRYLIATSSALEFPTLDSMQCPCKHLQAWVER